ncbi:hypothetical protein [Paenibacillus piri]|uniref:VCBS repeat-containing protein n=1 Tax=Paenibacillus piri TaxID=2547395 RepID=A0A4R5KUW2_9BACL|nr:hypothetical protein [Paenibacillus piri]TDF99729.1 hypothetical protein E1757_07855 [Paenibacillus piri]
MRVKLMLILIIVISLSAAGCGEKQGKQSDSAERAAQDGGHELTFNRVSLNELHDTKPEVEWIVIRTVDLGTADGKPISMLLYSEDSQNGEADVHAMIRHAEQLYELGANPFQLRQTEIRKLEGSFHDVIIIAGIGTNLTVWNVVAFNKSSGKLLTFETIGSPEVIDLDADGQTELVAAFEGTHLNFPNVEIIRFHNGEFESAQAVAAQNPEDPEYARLAMQSSGTVIEIGKLRDERPHRYKYENGRLVEM